MNKKKFEQDNTFLYYDISTVYKKCDKNIEFDIIECKFFEDKQKQVLFTYTPTRVSVLIENCEFVVENDFPYLNNDQWILLDILTKGFYYKTLKNYTHLKTFHFALECVRRGNPKYKEIFSTIRNAIDGKIGGATINRFGEISTTPPYELSENKIPTE